jgi:nucleotide-binding universal stress UspA family protein
MTDSSPTTQFKASHDDVGGPGPSVLLACFDRTDGSGNALAYAAGLAARTGARLVILTVQETFGLDCPPGVPACLVEVAGEVSDLVDHCRGQCEVAVEAGDPAGVIQRAANDLHADMIIVGQCRHAWTHPLGSVPGRLARHADQPVLIVP